MEDSIKVYLRDHLAGATMAIELLESLAVAYQPEPLGAFAKTMLSEITLDRESLQKIAERVGVQPSPVKELAARISEQGLSHKFKILAKDGFGLFEALEFLALGVLGKQKLWRALAVISEQDFRLQGIDMNQLLLRAESQHSELEAQRLTVISRAFKCP
jgi:hypothetical protein